MVATITDPNRRGNHRANASPFRPTKRAVIFHETLHYGQQLLMRSFEGSRNRIETNEALGAGDFNRWDCLSTTPPPVLHADFQSSCCRPSQEDESEIDAREWPAAVARAGG
jgi:hypothetical protein